MPLSSFSVLSTSDFEMFQKRKNCPDKNKRLFLLLKLEHFIGLCVPELETPQPILPYFASCIILACIFASF